MAPSCDPDNSSMTEAWQVVRRWAYWTCLSVAVFACRSAVSREARVIPNDNRTPAGSLQGGVLTLHLEAREARWFPDGEGAPSIVMQVFAEEGEEPRNPGPLIRVPAGTTIRVSVRNALRDSTLVVYGLSTRPSAPDDTMQIAPGQKRERSFVAGAPGTYFYWGSTTHGPVEERYDIDSQLHGAFIIDSAGSAPSPDRIFVLGSYTGLRDSSGYNPELRVINGLSWPHTESVSRSCEATAWWSGARSRRMERSSPRTCRRFGRRGCSRGLVRRWTSSIARCRWVSCGWRSCSGRGSGRRSCRFAYFRKTENRRTHNCQLRTLSGFPSPTYPCPAMARGTGSPLAGHTSRDAEPAIELRDTPAASHLAGP